MGLGVAEGTGVNVSVLVEVLVGGGVPVGVVVGVGVGIWSIRWSFTSADPPFVLRTIRRRVTGPLGSPERSQSTSLSGCS